MHTEFVIWGIPTGDSYEQVLYTKATSYSDAMKMLKLIESKTLATNCRVVIVNLDVFPDFTLTLNYPR